MYSSNCDRRLLKDDTDGVETISLGNNFHTLTTRLEKWYLVASIEQWYFISFMERPHVLELSASVNAA